MWFYLLISIAGYIACWLGSATFCAWMAGKYKIGERIEFGYHPYESRYVRTETQVSINEFWVFNTYAAVAWPIQIVAAVGWTLFYACIYKGLEYIYTKVSENSEATHKRAREAANRVELEKFIAQREQYILVHGMDIGRNVVHKMLGYGHLLNVEVPRHNEHPTLLEMQQRERDLAAARRNAERNSIHSRSEWIPPALDHER
jgi:hypothetical protein